MIKNNWYHNMYNLLSKNKHFHCNYTEKPSKKQSVKCYSLELIGMQSLLRITVIFIKMINMASSLASKLSIFFMLEINTIFQNFRNPKVIKNFEFLRTKGPLCIYEQYLKKPKFIQYQRKVQKNKGLPYIRCQVIRDRLSL